MKMDTTVDPCVRISANTPAPETGSLPNYPVPTTGEVGGAACCVRGISSGELSILFVPPCHLPEPPTGLGHVHRGVGVGVPPGASPTPALQPR